MSGLSIEHSNSKRVDEKMVMLRIEISDRKQRNDRGP